MINNNPTLKKIIDVYYKISYILEFMLAIPLAISILVLNYNKQHTGLWFLSNLVMVGIFSLITLLIVISHIIKYRDKLEKMFLTFAIPIGMMYAIYMLPTYVPDENTHLYRAYQISIGNFIEKREHPQDAPAVEIPTNLLESTIANEQVTNYGFVYSNLFGNNDYSKTTIVGNAAQNYFPILYVFSSAGLFVGKMLQLNPYITLYLAKIFNFISFLVLGYYTIKKLPFGKLLMLAYLMTPMMLHQATSLSADSLTNSVSLFFIAYTLKLVKREKVMNKKEEVLYYFLVAFIAIAKIAYMPLVVLSWLFIGNKNYTKAQKIRIVLISTILGTVLSLGWYAFGTLNYPDTRDYITENNINGTEQLKYILSNPLGYIKVLQNTLNSSLEYYLYTFIGHQLGWLDITVNLLTIIGFIILIVVAPIFSKREKTLDAKERLWLGVVFIGTCLLIFTGLYAGWTSVGGPIIEGIQGRYFIPIVILPLLCMYLKDKYVEFKYTNVVYPILLSLLNWSALEAILLYFI